MRRLGIKGGTTSCGRDRFTTGAYASGMYRETKSRRGIGGVVGSHSVLDNRLYRLYEIIVRFLGTGIATDPLLRGMYKTHLV